MIEIIFCDIDERFTEACFEEASKNMHLNEFFKFSVYNDDITKLKVKNAAFISPANCFGSMGGGIDEVYNRKMFPKIDKVVMEKISNLETKMAIMKGFDRLRKGKELPILPIGDAILTELTDYPKYKTCYLITAPTMHEPMNIEGTDYPKLAFYASLNIIKGNKKITTLVCPGLGTGVGCIPFQESAKQIFEAINEFVYE